jgi:hypothetical protein
LLRVGENLISSWAGVCSRPITGLHVVTAPVTIAVEHEDHEADPGGSCHSGFAGTAGFSFRDYRIDSDPGLVWQ